MEQLSYATRTLLVDYWSGMSLATSHSDLIKSTNKIDNDTLTEDRILCRRIPNNIACLLITLITRFFKIFDKVDDLLTL